MYHLKKLFAHRQCCNQITRLISRLLSGSRIALHISHTCVKNPPKLVLRLDVFQPICIVLFCFAQLGCGGSGKTTISGGGGGAGSQSYSISGTISLAGTGGTPSRPIQYHTELDGPILPGD